ncbi:Lysophospholipase L1 [Pseudobutyrivibrio sp. YE44]|uniref:SGNH/GDSL hydrolase family protein n=1 Tax=Pseudobutyrivibrio sp. YE44 TaxID=1520802 RepID=UPI00087E71BD|nr:SGNH/GDSL hydrolase family protein [Pseudobutyrivibrio sp. YE44]SDB30538.1 Lysophospholipase L1 [Pseudobutyrivibrio sp. YE44]
MRIRKMIAQSTALALLLLICVYPSHNTAAAEYDTVVEQEQSLSQQQMAEQDQVLLQQQTTDQTQVTQSTDNTTGTVQGVKPEVSTQEQLQVALANVAAEQSSRQLVFIGDSRTVGMNSAIGKDGNLWSAKVGMGLSWMKSTGVPAVEGQINANSDVVILMGVNDVRSLSYTEKYIKYINEKAATWTALGANVYYVSVNPITFESASYPGISNSLIEKWNARMQQGLSENVKYIDTYSQTVGKLSSKDGMHYNKSSYKTIYTLIQQGIISDKLYKEYNVLV